LDEAQAVQRGAFSLLRRWHVTWQTGPHSPEAVADLAKETHEFLQAFGGLIEGREE
jgi:hypothetical protein